jgi:hypothetical protein
VPLFGRSNASNARLGAKRFADVLRVADIVSAIQFMSTYRWAVLKIESCDQLGEPSSAKSWEEIFLAHPEFFWVKKKGDARKDPSGEELVHDEKTAPADEGSGLTHVALKYRYVMPYYNTVSKKTLDKGEYDRLSVDEKKNVTREPLTGDQVDMLLKLAIELHNRFLAQEQQSKWLLNLLFPLFGALIGAFGAVYAAVVTGTFGK